MTQKVHIDLQPALFTWDEENKNLFNKPDLPREPKAWREAVFNKFVDEDKYEILHGGHRNLVVREIGGSRVKTYWRESSARWMAIIKGVLLEHTLSSKLGIAGRKLVDEKKPVSISKDGLYTTIWEYTPGDIRYPWNRDEIASGSRLLSKLHAALRQVSFGIIQTDPSSDKQWLHGDAARGNMLFNDLEAIAVIDYEEAGIGDFKQDLGRTLSLMLVDTKNKEGKDPNSRDEYEGLVFSFKERASALLDNYRKDGGEPLSSEDKNIVSRYAAAYLMHQDYGGLNVVRSMAFDWLWNEWSFSQKELVELAVIPSSS